MKNDEYLGVAFEHYSLSGDGLYVRVFLVQRGDMVRVIPGFKQELAKAVI
jgi:hypothetical protein